MALWALAPGAAMPELEVQVGEGKLIVSGVDLLSDRDKRPEAQQLLYSLLKYMDSDRFEPSVSMTGEEVLQLFRGG